MRRLILRGGTLVDGTGCEPHARDVLIDGSKIDQIAPSIDCADALVFDCAGLIVAPGFIDSHSHSDLQVLENRREKLHQGVTSEVVGNCGFSPYPAGPDQHALHDFANGILCGGTGWGWPSARAYLADIQRQVSVAHVLSLVGHGALRIAFAGNKLGPVDGRTLDAMAGALSEALAEGACGFSTGLMYSPGASAPRDELEALCRVVARSGAVYATHMRDYSTQLVPAIEEQLDLARTTGCRLQISHLQAVGRANWHRQAAALETIEKARDEGIDVAFDCYPYVAGSTVMTQLLPQWTLEGGTEGLLKRLKNPDERARVASETLLGISHRWSDIRIAGVEHATSSSLVGRTIEEIADERGCEGIDAVVNLLIEQEGAVNILEFNQSEENLRQTLTHPLANIISDGFYVRGRPHPRLYGAFPEFLGTCCREKRWLSLADAVRRITGRPAERYRIRNRGLLEENRFADIVVFDADRITSPATYDNPEEQPTGIGWVLREGRILLGDEPVQH